MVENNPTPGSNSGKPSGLSWSTPPASANATPPLMPTATKSQTPPASSNSTKSAAAPAAKNTGPSPVMKVSMPSSSNNTSKMLGAVLGGIVIGGALMGAWYMWGGQDATTPTTTATTTTTGIQNTASPANAGGTGISSGSGNISVPALQDAGGQVAITNASVSQPTWIVVYESVGGQQGRALGATMFFPEYNGKGGTVTLLRSTLPGQTYLVGQHVDSGDHVFSVQGDKLLTNAAGNPVWVTFKTR